MCSFSFQEKGIGDELIARVVSSRPSGNKNMKMNKRVIIFRDSNSPLKKGDKGLSSLVKAKIFEISFTKKEKI